MASQGIKFSTEQERAFEDLFGQADAAYIPDGESFWYRGSRVHFQLTCDTAAIHNLPLQHQSSATSLIGKLHVSPNHPSGTLDLQIRTGHYVDRYIAGQFLDKWAIGNVLKEIVKIEPEVLREPEKALEHFRLFDNFVFIETDEIQKTFDPDPDSDEKRAIHLSLTRSKIHRSGPHKRMVTSQLALGRSIDYGRNFFAYWQTLQSKPEHPSIMLPQSFCFAYPGSFSAPYLGRQYQGITPNNELPLPPTINSNFDSITPFPRDLAAFEERLNEIPGNRFVGALSAADVVHLVTEPLDESLRLRLD